MTKKGTMTGCGEVLDWFGVKCIPSHLITALQFIVGNEDSQIHKWGSHVKSVTYHCITIGQIDFVNDGLSLFLIKLEAND